ncbi:MAG: protein kinase, partial [Acidobacteriota bacterium]
MVGQTLGHYRILEKLGEGGMGEVYRAEDLDLKRQVALKVLAPELATNLERLERFRREAQVLAALEHPNIVNVHSVESVDGLHFLTMELIDGETLAEAIPRQGMTLRQLFSSAIPMADALSKAHERGIVHRDFKPTNVMLTREGMVKVLDFGLAKIESLEESRFDSRAATEVLTGEGRILGTPSYMSPEQLKGEPVDHRSDIFSLGIVLYQAATGHRPFGGNSSAEVQSAILRDTPTPVDKIRRDAPHHLGRIINGCLEKDREDRYQSAKDVRNDLTRLRTELTSAEVEVPDQPEQLPAKRSGRTWARAAAVLLATVAIAVAARLVLAPESSRNWPDSVQVVDPQARLFFEQAKNYERRGDARTHLENAVQLYRQALAREPENPHLEAHLANLLIRLQLSHKDAARVEEARTLAQAALAAAPEDSCAWVAQGRVQWNDHAYGAARESALEAIEREPRNTRAHVLLAESLYGLGEEDAAVEKLRSAVNMEGGYVWAHPTLARLLFHSGRYDEAAIEYKKILAVLPDSPNALNNLGVIQMWNKNYEEAEELFKRSLRLQPDYMAAMNLGTVYFYMGRMQEAIGAYQEAYDLDADIALVQTNLAEAYEQIGAETLAQHWYQSALETYDREFAANPPPAEKISERAVCAAKLGRFDDAIAGIVQAVAAAKNDQVEPDSTVLFHAAKVYALAGRRSETISFAEQAVGANYP